MHLLLLRSDSLARAIYMDNPPCWVDGPAFLRLAGCTKLAGWMQRCKLHLRDRKLTVAGAMRLYGRVSVR